MVLNRSTGIPLTYEPETLKPVKSNCLGDLSEINRTFRLSCAALTRAWYNILAGDELVAGALRIKEILNGFPVGLVVQRG